jgi:GntR family transcriptional regulator
MVYNSRTIRPGTPEEILRLELQPEEEVLATERSLTADDEVVAFSYDAIPRSLLPDAFDPTTIESSLFQILAGHGLAPTSAVTELHASRDPEVGWRRRPKDPLYVLLDQVHYLPNARPVMHSRTFFHEGRFLFSLVRAS